MTACKTTLDIFEYTDNKNKMPTKEVIEFYNSYNLFYALYATIILIDNNSNIKKQFAYKKMLINFSWD